MIDIHAHIWGRDIENSKREILSAASRYKVEKVYVSALMNYVSDAAEVDFLNRSVYEFMQENPEQIGGAVYVNPQNANALDVIKKATQEQGFELIKLWCCTFADDPSVDPVMEYACDNGIPVLFHCFKKQGNQVSNETTGIHVRNIALRHPRTKIIMAHFGGNCYDGVPCVQDLKNVWCDQSGTIFHRNELIYAVENLGAERVLFGTDNAFASNIAQVLSAPLTEEQREYIFTKNAKKILNPDYRL